jgi:phosphoribosyl-AMP cyclohydrolase
MSAPLPIVWPEDGLIPAVIQDASSGDVLMVGFMNETALDRTRSTGFVHFWSRSRRKLWKKGETSGHVQRVEDIYVNCEQNSLLIEVDQTGAVCHTGHPTCYYRRLEVDNSLQTVRDRWFDPLDVYGNQSGLAGITALWWDAYAFLQGESLEAKSGTSRLLRGEVSVVPRLQDELRELAGVLDGTHVHGSQRDDALLEASQVCYWTAVEAIRTGIDREAVRPDRAFDTSSAESAPNPGTLARLIRAAAERLEGQELNSPAAHELFMQVAQACAALGIDPLEPIRRDIEELRGRDYLAAYFAR